MRAATARLKLAESGDLAAIRELADRLEGKPAVTTVITGDEDSPIRLYAEVPAKSASSQEWLEERKAPGLVLREMQVVRSDRVLTAGEADRKPAWASTEAGLAGGKGREGV